MDLFVVGLLSDPAKIRLMWRGEEFLHLKINEEVRLGPSEAIPAAAAAVLESVGVRVTALSLLVSLQLVF